LSQSKRLTGLTALALSAIGLSAHANTLGTEAAAGLTALSQLNLIVLGNMSGGDDVEGKTFVGGNLSNAATYGNGRSGVSVPASTYPTLTVGGNAESNFTINTGPDVSSPEGALIGGAAGTVNINGSPASLIVGGKVGNFNPNGDTYHSQAGPTIAAGIATQTAAFTTDLEALSTVLGKLTSTGSVTDTDPNDFTLTAKPNAAGYEVIDVSAAVLASAKTIIYAFSSAVPTIINVTGAKGYSFTDLANNNNGDAYASSVLWNFEGATTVDLQRQEEGGVLAPYATVSNVTPIEGSVAAASFDQGGEVHLGTFLGDKGLTMRVTSGVPEPATWTMLIGGVGLVGAALRSRRRAAMVKV
jgi:choice-of-anchor A domain-containing protein